MKRPAVLASYQYERDALLQRITRQAQADPRIAAAWLFGSLARIPAETRLLFDRVGLPRDDAPTRLVAGDARAQTIEEPLNSISFFWAMLMICAKGLYRDPAAAELREEPLLRYILDALHRVQGRLGWEPTAATAPGETITAKLDALRQLGREMDRATRQAAGQGLAVPERAAPAGMRYLEFIEFR